MSGDGESTPEKTRELQPAWQPGQSGNPKGRPKGARNKFGEAFLGDFLNDWEEHGAKVIVKVREDKPETYLRVAASILPQELNVKVSELDDLTDEQLDRRISAVLALIEAGAGSARDSAGSPEAAQSPVDVPTIQ
jgi:hypothetical protein